MFFSLAVDSSFNHIPDHPTLPNTQLGSHVAWKKIKKWWKFSWKSLFNIDSWKFSHQDIDSVPSRWPARAFNTIGVVEPRATHGSTCWRNQCSILGSTVDYLTSLKFNHIRSVMSNLCRIYVWIYVLYILCDLCQSYCSKKCWASHFSSSSRIQQRPEDGTTLHVSTAQVGPPPFSRKWGKQTMWWQCVSKLKGLQIFKEQVIHQASAIAAKRTETLAVCLRKPQEGQEASGGSRHGQHLCPLHVFIVRCIVSYLWCT